MKPVNQTKMTPPEGDCFAACITSILELPLNEVPNYSQRRKRLKRKLISQMSYGEWIVRKFL